MQLKELIKLKNLNFLGDKAALPRKILFQGIGFYSLDDNDGIYKLGIFPTYSRIKLEHKDLIDQLFRRITP